MNIRRAVSFFGSGAGKPGDPMYDEMVIAGQLATEAGYRVYTGGYSGTGMEAPASGARQAGTPAIGYYASGFGWDPNEFVQAVDCSVMGSQDWPNERAFGLRLGSLLLADTFIFAGECGIGTVVEFAAFMNLNAKVWLPKKRAALLRPAGVKLNEFDVMFDRILQQMGSELASHCRTVRSAQEAIEWACPQYS